MVSNLKVRYDVIDNLQTSLQDKKKTYRAQITLVNEGTVDIAVGDWALYLCSIWMIEEEHTAHNPQGFVVPGGHGIKVIHINGCLFKFAPTKDFKTMKHKDSLRLVFNASFWSVAITRRLLVKDLGLLVRLKIPDNGNAFQVICTIHTRRKSV